jgi:anti-sigma factor RsiW
MIHLRARRHLSGLPDGALSPRLEARVRAHAASCRRCQEILAQYEAMDRVLRRVPGPLLPQQPDAMADDALGLLASWSRAPGAWFERLPVHPLGAVLTAAALLLAVFLAMPPFELETAEPFNAVVLAEAPPARTRVRSLSEHAHIRNVPARQAPNETWLIPVAMK